MHTGYLNFYTHVVAMIRLFKAKRKQRELAENANGRPPVKKQTAVDLRHNKGLFHSPAMHI